MALKPYRRGRVWWMRGSLRGEQVRRSLDTRNQETAYTRIRDLERAADGGLAPATLADLRDGFLSGYHGETRRRYAWLLDQLASSIPERRFIYEITVGDLEVFLAGRQLHPNTVRRDIQALRAVWRYAVEHDLTTRNVAQKLRLPPEVPAETLPFMRAELESMRRAIATMRAGTAPQPERDRALRRRVTAQFLTLLYTGLRRRDVALLRRSAVREGRLIVRTSKKGTTVSLALKPELLAALRRLPAGGDYFFWTGRGRRETAASNLARTFTRVMRRAGVRGHLHRFRDTFAVELLIAGTDIRLVSKLLGHTSIRTTEKHYAPWVAAFQRQADEAVQRLDFGLGRKTVPKFSTAVRQLIENNG